MTESETAPPLEATRSPRSQAQPTGIWWLQYPAGEIEPPGPSRIEGTYPSDGLFYFARLPDRWLLASLCYSEFHQAVDHFVMWEHFLARELAAEWASQLAATRPDLTFRTLWAELARLPLAFPRGRVRYRLGERSDTPGVFAVTHGGDFPEEEQRSRKLVERCFWIEGRARWDCEEPERCRADQRDAMRELLGLEETWPAVESSSESAGHA